MVSNHMAPITSPHNPCHVSLTFLHEPMDSFVAKTRKCFKNICFSSSNIVYLNISSSKENKKNKNEEYTVFYDCVSQRFVGNTVY